MGEANAYYQRQRENGESVEMSDAPLHRDTGAGNVEPCVFCHPCAGVATLCKSCANSSLFRDAPNAELNWRLSDLERGIAACGYSEPNPVGVGARGCVLESGHTCTHRFDRADAPLYKDEINTTSTGIEYKQCNGFVRASMELQPSVDGNSVTSPLYKDTMSKDELLAKLQIAIIEAKGDIEKAHLECDMLLLEYIADARVSAIYGIDVEEYHGEFLDRLGFRE